MFSMLLAKPMMILESVRLLMKRGIMVEAERKTPETLKKMPFKTPKKKIRL